MFKHNLFQLLQAYKDNKTLCDAYMRGEIIEGMDNDSKKILGFGLGIFLVYLLVSLVLFVVALYLLITKWNKLEDWAKIVGIVGFFIPGFGNILTIVVCLIGQKK